MDQIVLVDSQVEAGEALLDRLAAEGIEVTAAGWVKVADEEGLYLYIASPLVEKEGLSSAYRRIHPIIRTLASPWLDPLEVKLVRPYSPVAKGMSDVCQQYPTTLPTRFSGTRLGNLTIDWAYIYSPVKATP